MDSKVAITGLTLRSLFAGEHLFLRSAMCWPFLFLEGGAQWWAIRFEPGAIGNGKSSTLSPSANFVVDHSQGGPSGGPGHGISGRHVCCRTPAVSVLLLHYSGVALTDGGERPSHLFQGLAMSVSLFCFGSHAFLLALRRIEVHWAPVLLLSPARE